MGHTLAESVRSIANRQAVDLGMAFQLRRGIGNELA